MNVPNDGDSAHRQGWALIDNPFPADWPEHALWSSDWKFRHVNALDTSADGKLGSWRPTETVRAWDRP